MTANQGEKHTWRVTVYFYRAGIITNGLEDGNTAKTFSIVEGLAYLFIMELSEYTENANMVVADKSYVPFFDVLKELFEVAIERAVGLKTVDGSYP